MTTLEFLSYLRSLEVRVWAEGDKLRYKSRERVMTVALVDELAKHKGDILNLLSEVRVDTFGALPVIQPLARDGELPLSFAQQRLWFLDQLESNSAAYNIPTAVRLCGQLNITALERSFSEVVRRHESLRTTFKAIDGKPVQVISPPERVNLLVEQLSAEARADDYQVEQLIREEAGQAFDLARGPLFRVRLLRLHDSEHVFLLTMHHLISDGWSIGILIHELTELYKTFTSGGTSSLPELPVQYVDFAHWQREWLHGEVLDRQLSYWTQQLGGATAVLELPTDYPRPAVQSLRGARQNFILPEKLALELHGLCRREGVTLFMALLAAFEVLLSRYTAQTDISVGMPIAGRNRLETEALIGFFVNTLVLRVDVSGNPSVRELLARVRDVALGAHAHQDLPFEKLVEELRPERSLSYTPLFQVMFALNVPREVIELADLKLVSLDVESGTSKFDLSLIMEERREGLFGSLEYNPDLFAEGTIQHIVGHYQQLLQSISDNPELRLSDLTMLSEGERHQLLIEWNETRADYPTDERIHELFEEQAERTPEAIAVIYEEEQVTYRELNARANQLAHFLQASGIGPEVLVGVCMERSVEMIVSLLAVLKAGGAYVPLDPAYPHERLSFMLDDAQVQVLLTEAALSPTLPQHRWQVICLDTDWPEISKESELNPVVMVQAENLAYIIYTSGSTGTPKGVAIEHQNAVALLRWAREVFPPEHLRGVLASSSISFDLSVFELFMPLSWGGGVILAQNALQLPELPAREHVTLVNTVPSVMAELIRMNCVPESAQLASLAGELLTGKLAREIYEQTNIAQLINLYGPAEDTTYSTYTRISRNDRRSPTIGRPITNTKIYLLDKYLQVVPVGAPGEIYIGGSGLARGYLNRPELTAEKFIPDAHSGEAGRRLYRTGDVARYLADGNIEFVGRLDEQVKLRGYRVELSEIERALSRHESVQECVVLVREGVEGDKRLVAYVVGNGPEEVNSHELRRSLREWLPEFMVPSAFVQLEQFPLTANGKLDRRALLAIEPDMSLSMEGYVAPRTPVEETLAGVWVEVLRVERVGVSDNFFELGGHSLLATQMISRVRQVFDVEFPPQSFFRNPTVAGQAETIEALRWAAQDLEMQTVASVTTGVSIEGEL